MGVNPRFIKLLTLGLCLVAVGAFVAVVAQVQPGSAQGQPAGERIASLESSLGRASEEEMQSGQLKDTERGRYFTGESAEKMESLHEQTQEQIDGIIARPESERQGAVAAIRTFAKNTTAEVVYQQTMKMPYGDGVAQVEIYNVGLDQYVVLPSSNKIVQVGERPTMVGEAGKQYDMTPRYNKAQLEAMAVAFIKEHAPEADLSKLTAQFGSKGAVESNDKGGAQNEGTAQDTNYFFRWEDPSPNLTGGPRDVAFIQVGFTIGGTFLSYTNTLAH